MTGDTPNFDDLIFEAHGATFALDSVTRRDGPNVVAAPVNNAKRVCSHLVEYHRTAWLTQTEAHLLDDALEYLKSRLKFFGESV